MPGESQSEVVEQFTLMQPGEAMATLRKIASMNGRAYWAWRFSGVARSEPEAMAAIDAVLDRGELPEDWLVEEVSCWHCTGHLRRS